MRLFPDEQKKKQFMKNGLPVIFAVAWTPIVWMVLTSVLGPVLERILPVWQLVVLIIAVASALVMVTLVRLFRRVGLKVFGEDD